MDSGQRHFDAAADGGKNTGAPVNIRPLDSALDQIAPTSGTSDARPSENRPTAEMVNRPPLPGRPPVYAEQVQSMNASMMNGLEITVLSVPSDSEYDNQDAAQSCARPGLISMSVSDGVSFSCRPNLLSRSLVDQFHSLTSGGKVEDWWQVCRRKWLAEVSPQYNDMNFAEQQVFRDQGARATFLGMIFDSYPQFTCSRYSVGDCAEIWLERGRMVHAEPSGDFDNFPSVLATQSEQVPEHFGVRSVEAVPSRQLLLTTDALGEYFIKHHNWETHPQIFDEILNMSEESFFEWCRSLYVQDKLKQDDWSVIAVSLPDWVPIDLVRYLPAPKSVTTVERPNGDILAGDTVAEHN